MAFLSEAAVERVLLDQLRGLGYQIEREEDISRRYPLRRIDVAASRVQGKAVRLDAFEPGSRFEDAVRLLYVFDKKL